MQFRRQYEIVLRAAQGVDRRPGKIQRKIHAWGPRELPLPKSVQHLKATLIQRAPLPRRKVEIIHRQRRKARSLTGKRSVVEGSEFAEQDRDRASFEDDVVHDEQKLVFLLSGADQQTAKHGIACEMERACSILENEPGRLLFASLFRQAAQISLPQVHGPL